MFFDLWHEVMIKKYINNKTMEEWFRQRRFSWSGSSNFWRALTASLSIIINWSVWKLGNGMVIRIGSDPLVGSHTYYKLSKSPILNLKALGIESLAQAGTSEVEDITFTRWKKDEPPGLVGDQKEEWNNFFKGMVGSDFVINNSKYILLWSWDQKRGNVNANLAYKFRMVELREVEPYFWYNELWNWKLPLKVKLFVWLMLK